MEENEKSSFDISAVIAHFNHSLHEKDDIKIISYVQAYEELSKLFSILGMIFSFVEVDVTEKRGILRSLYEKDPENYDSVQKMIRYEFFGDPEKPNGPGSRTLLRLHRALAFLIHFVQRLTSAKEGDNVSIIFRTSYQETLANHHTWLIRQSVSIASRMVPNRQKLIEDIFANHEKNPTPEYIEELSTTFLTVVEEVHKRVQNLYEEKKLLNLP